MNALGIYGSPRKHGNTHLLLDAALAGCQEAGARVERIFLNDLKFRPCQECHACDSTGQCVIADDMAMVYQSVGKADRILIASPVFFASVSAQTKMMIDRFQCWWVAKYRLARPPIVKGERRRGLFLCVGGTRHEEFVECTALVVKIFFTTLNIAYEGCLSYMLIDEKGAIANHPTALKDAHQAGFRLVSGTD